MSQLIPGLRSGVTISPYVAAIRRRIGGDLLLLPTVAVLPVDEGGRILLVRHTDTGRWATIGGSVEVDESPQDAAVREAKEEARISVGLTRLLTAVGGPDYRITYPNGDQVACVAIVYQARVLSGRASPDGDETFQAGWFLPDHLLDLDLNDFNLKLLHSTLPLLG